MDRPLRPWPTGDDPAAVAALLSALRAALDGSGPALAPHPATADAQRAASRLPPTVPQDVAVVVRTSGSTGRARWVQLDGAALRASVEGTHERLGGPGRWVLALPTGHVAGLMILVRSVLAGTEPVVVAGTGGAPALAAALERESADPGVRTYAALVPTQLHRLVTALAEDAGTPRATALRGLDALLVGGAATAPNLLGSARELDLPVVTTYGMTETCGGCVYDGVALRDVRVAVHGDVVHLGGPVLAQGYLPDPVATAGADPFIVVDGERWLRTSDLGELRDGRLRVLGRGDDVLITGGVKVRPGDVEHALAALPEVAQVCVVGVPDEEWGQRVTAVVVPLAGTTPELDRLRAAVSRTLGSAAAPRRLVLVDALPGRGPGKVDRSAVLAMVAPPPGGPR